MVSHAIQDGRKPPGKRARNSNERKIQLQKLWNAEREACRQQLEGRLRFDLLKHRAGFSEHTDDSQIRRLLREARQLFAGGSSGAARAPVKPPGATQASSRFTGTPRFS